MSPLADVYQNLALLLRVLLSLSFASAEELGWDPTIRPFIGPDGNRLFRIDVDGQTFETCKIGRAHV